MSDRPQVSVIVPGYNEAGNIERLFERIAEGLKATGLEGEAVFVDGNAGGPDVPALPALLGDQDELRHRLGDARPAADGTWLVYHGYCFDVRGSHLVAWPLRAGRTGEAAFALGPGGTVLAHANGARNWSGASGSPDAPTLGAGWTALD